MTDSAAIRRPRADAERNRKRIVEAAVEAFREEGFDVSVAEIARRAEVGSGTLFRNFPTKNDLVVAIVEMHMERWLDVVSSAIEADDHAAAFDEFFAEAVRFNYNDRGMLEAAREGLFDLPDLYACKCRALDSTGELLALAKTAGAVRDEITTDDFYALATGAAESAKVAVREREESPATAMSRYVKIVLAGLRP